MQPAGAVLYLTERRDEKNQLSMPEAMKKLKCQTIFYRQAQLSTNCSEC